MSEILELINEVGITAKIKRQILILKYGLTQEEAYKLCPDKVSDL